MLGLPVKLCAGRAAHRKGHEGGVEGPSAPRVVQMMHAQLAKAGPPSKAEGLTSIMVGTDVKSAPPTNCKLCWDGSLACSL